MAGGIYSDQTCKICGGAFIDMPREGGLFCKKHKEEGATRFMVKFPFKPKPISKRFTRYDEAATFLGGLRFKESEGTLDRRDYMASTPLGFTVLAEEYLTEKKTMVREKHFRNVNSDMQKAIAHWDNTNVKEIGFPDLKRFLFPKGEDDLLYGLSQKTRANIKSTLHNFWTWLVEMEHIEHHQAPRFPTVKYNLSYRNTVCKEDQNRILNKVYELTARENPNPRIWLGIKFLSTYFNVRPGELIQIREKDIDLKQKRILLRATKTKEGKDKYLFLLDEDVELIRSIRGKTSPFPEMYFFRHVKGNGAAKPGQRFGHDYLYKWWKRACKDLGIEGVDLYGGTKHSTVLALRERGLTPEEIKRASGHSTNKAFERYLRITASEVTRVFAATRSESCQAHSPKLHTISDTASRG